ncbi:transmembrane protein 177 [Nymphalis io]|uniref:transmembrane protein 177 n=1 Tax=Inachis io TaxID=171585 RepID=UPI002167058D|nr:transmembrane protein 177 [Nymphalis io]XP_050347143.1 transmembrane protein 177 [Nymphalis io]
MSSKKPISWFLSEKGRKFSFAVVTSTGLALTAARFSLHTFLLGKYKDFVHYYSNGKPAELPSELHKKYEKCLDLLEMSAVHRKLIQPFCVFGYDLFHAGSTSSKFGALVGIPINFTYKSLNDVEQQNVQVNQKTLDLSSEIGKKLGESLILTDKVKEFAICREMLMTQNNKIIFESVYPFLCIFLVYNFSQYMNRRLNLYVAPLNVRAILYSIVGLFGLGSYFLLKDMTEIYYETEADKKLCELGPDYIESGVIFYEKLLQRNQALRELMGKEGEKKYTKLGNENYGIRQPHVALIHRKQFFDLKLKECTEKNDDNKDNNSDSI